MTALRSHHYPTQSHTPYPNKVRWSMIWMTASVFVLILLGVILATHC